jgi:hypothetical protein
MLYFIWLYITYFNMLLDILDIHLNTQKQMSTINFQLNNEISKYCQLIIIIHSQMDYYSSEAQIQTILSKLQ